MSDNNKNEYSNGNTLFNAFMPTVIKKTNSGERVYDLPSRLFQERIIILNGEINGDVATAICSQLLVLQHENPKAAIQMIINSPGGDTVAGFAIYDMMMSSTCPISTICLGQACSFGAMLFVAGTKGMRYILPNSRVLLHQPWGGLRGQVTDIDIHFKDMMKTKERAIKLVSDHTGQPADKVAADMERDFILYAEDAIKYGAADKIQGTEENK